MKLAVIGAGQMGQALTRRFVEADLFAPEEVLVYDKDETRMNDFAALIHAQTCVSGKEAARQADYILLAVKPQVCQVVVRDLASVIHETQVIVSIAAGITLSQLRSWSNGRAAVVRVMPNLPAVIGQGVSALCFSKTNTEQEAVAHQMFSACGMAFELEEQLLDAVTGLSGSGPAYVMLMIEALADGAVLQGMPRDQALKMAAMTLKGSAQLVLDQGKHPGELKDQVCSPGGTTIAAVRVLEEQGIRSSLIEAVAAATRRSEELRLKD